MNAGEKMHFNFANSKIYYEAHGEGIPVICIHGYFLDHRVMTGCLEPVFSQLNGYKRIYMDLPGMGKSIPGDDIKSGDNIYYVLKNFVEKITNNCSYVLIGESYGVYLSRRLIKEHMDRIPGLELICPVIAPSKSARKLPDKFVIYEDSDFSEKLSKNEKDFYNQIGVLFSKSNFERVKEEIITPPLWQMKNS